MTTPQEIYERDEAFTDDADNVRPPSQYADAIRTVVTMARDIATVERERDEARAALERVEALAHIYRHVPAHLILTALRGDS